MSKSIKVIKVMPDTRRIAEITIKPSIATVKRLVGAKTLGHKALIVMEGSLNEMRVVADAEAPEGTPSFRIMGSSEETHGTSLLFGKIENIPAMFHCPMSLEMVRQRIIWGDDGAKVEGESGEKGEAQEPGEEAVADVPGEERGR